MDYTPLNNHMRVKNHMAMWILWILWILWVEYSAKRLYKPLCAFLVFVDLVWILWILWILWVGGLALDARCSMPTIARPLALCGSVVLPSMLDARCRRLRVLLLFVD